MNNDVVRAGDVVRIGHVDYRVEPIQGAVLVGPHRAQRELSALELLSHPDFTLVEQRPIATLRDMAVFDELPEQVREKALWWHEHVRDVLTGREWDGMGWGPITILG